MKGFLHRLRVWLAICMAATSVASGAFTVVIDAGHGGRDSGARGVRCSEKDVTLAVAKALGTRIARQCAGVSVCYTRVGDEYVDLDERVRRAQAARGDVLISLHANSMAHRVGLRDVATGAATYVMQPATVAAGSRQAGQSDEEFAFFELQQAEFRQQSINFATEIQRELVATAHRRDEGVHQASFHVLQHACMPAVLVEMDYMSHRQAEQFLSSQQGQALLAQALCRAFVKWYNFKLGKR